MLIERKYIVRFDGGWEVAAVRDTLLSAQHVVLVAHTNADGDAVGSVLAMRGLLVRAGVPQVTAMLPDGCPDDMAWLPGTEGLLDASTQESACREAIASADLVMGLDISCLDRTGRLCDMLRASQEPRMLVDHHESPDREAFGLVVSEPEVSSTCELVYWLMLSAFGEELFDRDTATCLYAGMCTDTGTFAYSNTHESLYLAAAGLLRYGIDPMDINRHIKNVFTETRLKFFGHAMAERLTVYREQQVALMVLTADEMAAYGVHSHELTGLINEVMKLRDIDCGILVREEKISDTCPKRVRLSLRSKSRYDVNRLASEMFGGGGHVRAAGATSTLSLGETVEVVKRKLRLSALLLPFLLCLGLTSCREVPVVDTTAPEEVSLKENLINANRLIAQSEEQQIDSYVARRGWQMQRLDGGARVMETTPVAGRPVEYEDTVVIRYRVESLNGTVIYDRCDDTVVVGRQRPTRGLDAALRTLHHGASARVILPSEQAYGVVGDGDRIGSRMVLVYEVKVES